MEWKEEKDTRFSDGTREDAFEEDEYPVWEKQKRFSFTEALMKKIEIPLILMAVGIVVLIALFLASVVGKSDSIEMSRFEAMEKKVQAVEERLAKTEGENAKFEGPAEYRKELGQLQKKVSQIENSVALRMDQIATEVAGLKKQPSAPPAQELAKAQKESPQEAPAPKNRFHQVRPGETLFSISRQYNIGVDELRKMNNLSSNAIHPGDKLVVGRSER